MILKDTGSSSFTPCPAGSELARCIHLIDLGTQTSTFDGETKSARKILIAFEVLSAETRRENGEPFILSKRFTVSLHEKSALRKMCTSWRGRDFTPAELKGFDLATVLGKDAFLSIVHTEKDGKTYANIAAVMKPPKSMTAPEGTANEPLLHWDMGAPDWAAFAFIQTRLAEQIEASPEFGRLTKPRTVQLSAPVPAPLPTRTPAMPAKASGFDDMDSDVPF